MEDIKIKIGDTVWLKTGGAAMMVQVVQGDGITCVWHDDNRSSNHVIYHRAVLTKEQPNATKKK